MQLLCIKNSKASHEGKNRIARCPNCYQRFLKKTNCSRLSSFVFFSNQRIVQSFLFFVTCSLKRVFVRSLKIALQPASFLSLVTVE